MLYPHAKKPLPQETGKYLHISVSDYPYLAREKARTIRQLSPGRLVPITMIRLSPENHIPILSTIPRTQSRHP